MGCVGFISAAMGSEAMLHAVQYVALIGTVSSCNGRSNAAREAIDTAFRGLTWTLSPISIADSRFVGVASLVISFVALHAFTVLVWRFATVKPYRELCVNFLFPNVSFLVLQWSQIGLIIFGFAEFFQGGLSEAAVIVLVVATSFAFLAMLGAAIAFDKTRAFTMAFVAYESTPDGSLIDLVPLNIAPLIVASGYWEQLEALRAYGSLHYSLVPGWLSYRIESLIFTCVVAFVAQLTSSKGEVACGLKHGAVAFLMVLQVVFVALRRPYRVRCDNAIFCGLMAFGAVTSIAEGIPGGHPTAAVFLAMTCCLTILLAIPRFLLSGSDFSMQLHHRPQYEEKLRRLAEEEAKKAEATARGTDFSEGESEASSSGEPASDFNDPARPLLFLDDVMINSSSEPDSEADGDDWARGVEKAKLSRLRRRRHKSAVATVLASRSRRTWINDKGETAPPPPLKKPVDRPPPLKPPPPPPPEPVPPQVLHLLEVLRRPPRGIVPPDEPPPFRLKHVPPPPPSLPSVDL
jgi:hypothetical protein